MPIKPEKEETKVDFMERCMSDGDTTKEYSDEGEREEYCTIQFNTENTEEEETKAAVSKPEEDEKEKDFMARCIEEGNEEDACQIAWDKTQDKEEPKEDKKEDKEVEAAVPKPEDDEKEKDFIKRCVGEGNEEEACQIAWDKSVEKDEDSGDIDKELEKELAASDLFVYDMIGVGGVTAKNVVDELGTIGNNSPVNLRVNSAGGDVFEGIAIYNSLKKHTGSISVEIEGLAASMASIVMLAGDEITASENSLIMIHNPSIGIQGESKDLSKKAELLDKIKTQMVDIYTSKTGLSEKEVIKMMDNETWLTAQEAKDKGFIDNVGAKINVAADTKLSVFATAPNWVLKSLNNPNKSVMDSIVETLTNLTKKITGFKSELPKGVNILDEKAIKNELVTLSETINTLSSVNDELVDTLQIVATQEAEIKNLAKMISDKDKEINKMNATPTKVAPKKDPSISLSSKAVETSGWDEAMKSLMK